MTSSVPPQVRIFITALEARGYALRFPSELDDGDAHTWIMELSPNLPGGEVAILRLDSQWHVGIKFGSAIRSPLEVRDLLDGRSSGLRPQPVPVVEEAQHITLSVLDRLHGDRAAAARVWAHLGPQSADTALAARGNDPCWCGSGKKIKRCHKTLDP